ncbi:hypothetical protein Tco_0697041 [Tanacetum coccineum]
MLPHVMSTPAYVDSKTITQADEVQSSRVPVPLPDDPYVATSSSSSPSLLGQKRYKGTSELILDTDSEGDESGEEDTKEDEEDKSSDADDEREIQGLDDEGHGLGDEDHGLGDESQGLEGEGLSLEEEAAPEGQQQAVLVVDTAVQQSSRYVPEHEGVERIFAFRQPTLVTWVDLEDDRVYTDVPAYAPTAAPVQAPPSPEWSLGSLPVSPSSLVVPSPIASSMSTPTTTISVDEDQFIEVGAQLELHGSILYDHTQRLDALPPTLVADIDRDVRELYTRSGVVRDEIFLQRYMFRSLEREQERTTVTFELCGGSCWHWRHRQGMLIPDWQICHGIGDITGMAMVVILLHVLRLAWLRVVEFYLHILCLHARVVVPCPNIVAPL